MAQQNKTFNLNTILTGSLLFLIVFFSQSLAAETELTTNDKIYTKKQAKLGETLYKDHCLLCHDKKYFRPVFETWEGQSLGTFFLVMNASMPESNPGSLTTKEYIDIMAYMLSLNRYASGEKELSASSETLNLIKIASRKR
ncbi:MAG: hypothetical protein VYC67_05530 [Pseudomonadota bacterium]|nr:hypothetical protein [Pseudomonadota bacterium]